MRLTPDQLQQITGLQQPAAQSRWFKQHLGATVPHDERGPIITEKAYEALVAQACGVIVAPAVPKRPKVKLKEREEA